MPTVTKVTKPATKGKRGRPKGSKNVVRETVHIFTAEDGCKLETGIRKVTATCKHGYDMTYTNSVERMVVADETV